MLCPPPALPTTTTIMIQMTCLPAWPAVQYMRRVHHLPPFTRVQCGCLDVSLSCPVLSVVICISRTSTASVQPRIDARRDTRHIICLSGSVL